MPILCNLQSPHSRVGLLLHNDAYWRIADGSLVSGTHSWLAESARARPIRQRSCSGLRPTMADGHVNYYSDSTST